MQLTDLGYRLFPVAPGAKSPLTTQGCKDATSDWQAIQEWADRFPECNWGLATDGLVVIDIDGVDNPWPIDQDQAASLLKAGAITSTPRGGRHYFFRQPEGKGWRNTASKVAEKVDTRGNGGYVVLAGSSTPDGQYQWLDGCELTQAPGELPEPPDWLVRELDKIGKKPSQEKAQANQGKIPEGQRNGTLASIGGSLRRIGLNQSEILAALLEINTRRCQPPLEVGEVERIADSISKYEAGKVDGVDTPESVYGCMVPVERLLASEEPKPEAIIPGYAGKGDLVTLFGASKSLKSFSALELAIQAAMGGSWFTGNFQRRMKVGYLDGEIKSIMFRERIVDIAKQLDIPTGEITNICLWPLRDYPDVVSVEQFIQDRFKLEPLGMDLLIIDNLSRFYPWWDKFSENDNAAMTKVMRLYQQMAGDLNICILLVHHTAKGIHDGRSVSDMGAGAGAIGRFSDGNAAIGRMRPDDDEHGKLRWMFKCTPRNYPSVSIPIVQCGVLWRPSSLFGLDSGEADPIPWHTAECDPGEKINPDEAATFTKRLSDAFADHVTPGTGASINTMIGWVGGSKVWARGMVHSLIADGTLVSCGEHRGHLRYRLSGVQLDMEAGSSDSPEVP